MSSPLLSRVSLEAIASWAEVLTVAFTMLGAACGVAYVAANRPLKRLQEKESLEEKRTTAQAQADAARAQLELKQYVEQAYKQAGPRKLSPKFAEALQGKPTGTVDILYAPEDMEAYTLALQMWHALRGSGWTAAHPTPIPADGELGLPGAPTQFRYGVGAGLLLLGKTFPANTGKSTAADAIWEATQKALDITWSFVRTTDPTLPDDHFVIAIGQKM